MNGQLRQIIRQLGLVNATIIVTIISILVSIIASLGANYLLLGKCQLSNILTAIVVPLIVSPPICIILLRLLFELDRKEVEVRAQSRIDPLTQVNNRGHFFELAAREISAAARYLRLVALVIFDLDGFKAINDTYGHPTGDLVLQEIAKCCQGLIRKSDLLGRYGGDEFVFLLPETDSTALAQFAQRLIQAVKALDITSNGAQVQLSISLGAAICQPGPAIPTIDFILSTADQALYAAKEKGGNEFEIKVCPTQPRLFNVHTRR